MKKTASVAFEHDSTLKTPSAADFEFGSRPPTGYADDRPIATPFTIDAEFVSEFEAFQTRQEMMQRGATTAFESLDHPSSAHSGWADSKRNPISNRSDTTRRTDRSRKSVRVSDISRIRIDSEFYRSVALPSEFDHRDKSESLSVYDVRYRIGCHPPLDIRPDNLLNAVSGEISLSPIGRRDKFASQFCSPESSAILESLFWYSFVVTYQPNAKREAENLLAQLSEHMTRFFWLTEKQSRESFFSLYHFALGNCVCRAFYVAFPSSRSFFNTQFQDGMYKLVAESMTGVEFSRTAIRKIRRRLFPSRRVAEFFELLEHRVASESQAALSSSKPGQQSSYGGGAGGLPPISARSVSTAGSAFLTGLDLTDVVEENGGDGNGQGFDSTTLRTTLVNFSGVPGQPSSGDSRGGLRSNGTNMGDNHHGFFLTSLGTTQSTTRADTANSGLPPKPFSAPSKFGRSAPPTAASSNSTSLGGVPRSLQDPRHHNKMQKERWSCYTMSPLLKNYMSEPKEFRMSTRQKVLVKTPIQESGSLVLEPREPAILTERRKIQKETKQKLDDSTKKMNDELRQSRAKYLSEVRQLEQERQDMLQPGKNAQRRQVAEDIMKSLGGMKAPKRHYDSFTSDFFRGAQIAADAHKAAVEVEEQFKNLDRKLAKMREDQKARHRRIMHHVKHAYAHPGSKSPLKTTAGGDESEPESDEHEEQDEY